MNKIQLEYDKQVQIRNRNIHYRALLKQISTLEQTRRMLFPAYIAERNVQAYKDVCGRQAAIYDSLKKEAPTCTLRDIAELYGDIEDEVDRAQTTDTPDTAHPQTTDEPDTAHPQTPDEPDTAHPQTTDEPDTDHPQTTDEPRECCW